MEELCLEDLQLLRQDAFIDSPSPLRALFSCRAIICNPASSEVALRSVVDAIVHLLGRDPSPPLLRPAVKLIADVVVLHPALMPSVVAAVRPLLSSGKRPAAEALAVLVSAAQSGGEGSFMVRSVMGEDLILSLASSRAVAVRSQLLRLLALESQYVREMSSADGRLVAVLRKYSSGRLAGALGNAVAWMEISLMQRCYDVGVELLHDVEVFVRMSAIRLVSELGQMLMATKQVTDNGKFSDAQFLMLCSVARDMDMRVRVEVFLSLEKIKLVSENVLVQSLSKKVKKGNSGGKSLAEFSEEGCGLPISCAAGVFLQGLEDEFHEVRRAACFSLGTLTILSAKFADNALDFLMDMLNDDSDAVQLQALQTLFQMTSNGNMNVQERHMHMFLGTLANSDAPIRCAARNVLRLTRLPNMALFRLSINGLLGNLEAYGEDEEDIFAALFCIGRAHRELAARITAEYAQEIEPPGPGEMNLDRPRVVALLVLGIAPSLSNEALTQTLPARMFSYAVPLLGRISRSLKDFISQDALLSFLCKHSGLPFLETDACKEELEMVDQTVSEASAACLVFALEYVQLLLLVAEVWGQLQQPKVPHIMRIRKLDLLLGKLEVNLGRMRYCFLGLGKAAESHLLELSLLQCVLRLSTIGTQEALIVRKMRFLISRLELLVSEEKFEISAFVKESRNFCSQWGVHEISGSTRIVDLLELCSLGQMEISGGGLRCRKAELRSRADDPDQLPLPFVPGLPIGIPLDITLHNISSDDRVWLRMTAGGSTQYAFLSLDRFVGSDVERRCAADVPFYATPTVPFLLKACVCLECSRGYLTRKSKGQRGPRRETVDLTEEMEIYLVDVGQTVF
ncbi:unnamed protein product [Spirodela intermedia]|uniref:Uncharacterized protein n=1 Tax=Spirodela intermedia TaxID=51605 RepID=A0A7I8JGR2_SPIIN|nr:unnamed protein product [Spirodela intermedia]CAA6669347.1 unnamed protein product [Spirodela intermedia]